MKIIYTLKISILKTIGIIIIFASLFSTSPFANTKYLKLGMQKFDNDTEKPEYEFWKVNLPDNLHKKFDKNSHVAYMHREKFEQYTKQNGVDPKDIGRLIEAANKLKIHLLLLGSYTVKDNYMHTSISVFSLKQRGIIYKFEFKSKIDASIFKKLKSASVYISKKLNKNKFIAYMINKDEDDLAYSSFAAIANKSKNMKGGDSGNKKYSNNQSSPNGYNSSSSSTSGGQFNGSQPANVFRIDSILFCY